jgi:hypothetical protein
MKFLVSIIFVLFVNLTFSTSYINDIGNEIASAIRVGNAKELAKFFNTNIDLTILGKEELYSRAQAEQIMHDFFVKNPPRNFVLKHQSTSQSSSQYGIGNYESRNGSKFRVYFLIRRIGNQSFIQQLSIEKDNT